jgi:hypothetical protein
VDGGVSGSLRNHIVAGETILLYGEDGAITRSTDGGASFARVDRGVTGWLGDHIVAGETILLHGGDGAITRSTDGGASFARVDGGVTGYLGNHIVAGETILLYGEDGTVVRIHGGRAAAARDLNPSPGADGDAALRGFLDALPAHIRTSDAIARLSGELAQLVARRPVLDGLAADTADEKNRLDRTPLSLLQRERVQMAFADFLRDCRGKADPPDKDLTEDCLTAWTSYQSGAAGHWWQTLADQTPPGILLLFLLATLGSLYRYNLRLAGFHDSRADLLVAISMGRDTHALRDFLSENKGDVINQLALAFAADKVEMGAIKARLAQAELEIARAMSAEK